MGSMAQPTPSPSTDQRDRDLTNALTLSQIHFFHLLHVAYDELKLPEEFAKTNELETWWKENPHAHHDEIAATIKSCFDFVDGAYRVMNDCDDCDSDDSTAPLRFPISPFVVEYCSLQRQYRYYEAGELFASLQAVINADRLLRIGKEAECMIYQVEADSSLSENAREAFDGARDRAMDGVSIFEYELQTKKTEALKILEQKYASKRLR